MSSVPHCEHDLELRKRRFIAKPIGSFSVAGNQPKVSAIEVEVCDACWDVMQVNLREARAAIPRALRAAPPSDPALNKFRQVADQVPEDDDA